MTQKEFEKRVKVIMENATQLIEEAGSEEEKRSIYEAENNQIQALLKELN